MATAAVAEPQFLFIQNVAQQHGPCGCHGALLVALRYLTEIKQDATDNDREYLERRYLTQAAEYSNTNSTPHHGIGRAHPLWKV